MRGDQRDAGHMGLGKGERRTARTEPHFGKTGSHVAGRASEAAVSRKPPVILGIESSCDETAAAVITGDRQILSHRLAGQESEHAPYGGVVPEIAARAHVEAVMPLVEAALTDAKLGLADLDAIAATAGPGLIGGVMVGLVTAKALAHAAGKPLIAVNHLEGHALSPRLTDPDLDFPYLLLLVSGGHCQLLSVEGVGRYRRLATTIDDAAGEAFDKTAKLLGLGFPGGPAVEQAAAEGDAKAVLLPRPLLGSPEPHFSFAGLKSAVLRARDAGIHRPQDIAASFQAAVVDCLIDRTRRAIERAPAATALVVAGGVAANTAIRAALATLAHDNGLRFVAPPQWLCTDNAAMIGWAGAERFALGLTDGLDVAARPRWPLDPEAEAVRGAGVKA
jgi:N6-L-threonylcarbamoyladenine synthase